MPKKKTARRRLPKDAPVADQIAQERQDQKENSESALTAIATRGDYDGKTFTESSGGDYYLIKTGPGINVSAPPPAKVGKGKLRFSVSIAGVVDSETPE